MVHVHQCSIVHWCTISTMQWDEVQLITKKVNLTKFNSLVGWRSCDMSKVIQQSSPQSSPWLAMTFSLPISPEWTDYMEHVLWSLVAISGSFRCCYANMSIYIGIGAGLAYPVLARPLFWRFNEFVFKLHAHLLQPMGRTTPSYTPDLLRSVVQLNAIVLKFTQWLTTFLSTCVKLCTYLCSLSQDL